MTSDLFSKLLSQIMTLLEHSLGVAALFLLAKFLHLLGKIAKIPEAGSEAPAVTSSQVPEDEVIQLQMFHSKEMEMYMIPITTMTKTTLTFKAINSKKQIVAAPVAFVDTPAWSIVPVSSVVQLLPSSDGFACDVLGAGIGTVQIKVQATVTTSTGPKVISGTIAVQVVEDPRINEPILLQVEGTAAVDVVK